MKRFFKYHPDSLENNRNDKWRKIAGILLASLTAGIVFLLMNCLYLAFLLPTNLNRLYVAKWDTQHFQVIFLVLAFTAVFCGIFVFADFVLNRPKRLFLDFANRKKRV